MQACCASGFLETTTHGHTYPSLSYSDCLSWVHTESGISRESAGHSPFLCVRVHGVLGFFCVFSCLTSTPFHNLHVAQGLHNKLYLCGCLSGNAWAICFTAAIRHLHRQSEFGSGEKPVLPIPLSDTRYFYLFPGPTSVIIDSWGYFNMETAPVSWGVQVAR